jgi:putative membrane protein
MKRQLMMAAAAVLLFATPTLAQNATTVTPTTPTTNSTTATPTNANDNPQVIIDQMSKVTTAQDFVNFASMSDAFEVQSGKMAQKQAGNKAVKKFGQQLVSDHTRSSKALLKLAKAEKIDLMTPVTLDQRHQSIADSMKDAKGSAFDTAFLQAQVQAHQEGIALFQSYSTNGDNDKLKAFAKKGLPVLKKHLEMAQKLSGQPQTTTQTQ